MNKIGISALSLTLVFFIVNLILISKKADKGIPTESKIIETPEGVTISGNLNNIDGNIESKGDIKAYDFNSERNLNSGLDISAKGNAFIDGYIETGGFIKSKDHIIADKGLESKAHISAVGNIESDKEVYAKNFILQDKENDVISNRKHVLAVSDDNKIYKNNELWSDSYNTESDWVIPLGDTMQPLNDFLKDSSDKRTHQNIIGCEPNQYVCGILTNYGQKADKEIHININAKCCNFPEGFPKPAAKVNIVKNY